MMQYHFVQVLKICPQVIFVVSLSLSAFVNVFWVILNVHCQHKTIPFWDKLCCFNTLRTGILRAVHSS